MHVTRHLFFFLFGCLFLRTLYSYTGINSYVLTFSCSFGLFILCVRVCFSLPSFSLSTFHQVYISSTKSMMGHTLGAAGGLEAIVCAQVLRHGEIPPTKNLENPALEDGCDLNYCPGEKVGLIFGPEIFDCVVHRFVGWLVCWSCPVLS